MDLCESFARPLRTSVWTVRLTGRVEKSWRTREAFARFPSTESVCIGSGTWIYLPGTHNMMMLSSRK